MKRYGISETSNDVNIRKISSFLDTRSLSECVSKSLKTKKIKAWEDGMVTERNGRTMRLKEDVKGRVEADKRESDEIQDGRGKGEEGEGGGIQDGKGRGGEGRKGEGGGIQDGKGRGGEGRKGEGGGIQDGKGGGGEGRKGEEGGIQDGKQQGREEEMTGEGEKKQSGKWAVEEDRAWLTISRQIMLDISKSLVHIDFFITIPILW